MKPVTWCAVFLGAALFGGAALAQDAGGPPSYARGRAQQGQFSPGGPGQDMGGQDMGGPGGGDQRGGRRGPPPGAVSACSGLGDGDQCSFATPRGDTLGGTCRQVPEGVFACVPGGMGGQGMGGGPRGPQRGGSGGGMGGYGQQTPGGR
jgi:hypothetical protein